MMYWQKEIETMDRKDLVKFQLERLKQTIELAGNSPFYHKIFKEKGITPDSFLGGFTKTSVYNER